VVHLTKAIQLNSKNSESYILLSNTQLELKNPEEAKKALRKYLEIDPFGTYAQEAQKRLDIIK
jgi:hypothetical protein